ncbi:MAG: FAD:protein FMN transferase [Acidobacteriota bacterium]
MLWTWVASAQDVPSTTSLQARAFDAPVSLEIVDLESPSATRDALADALTEINEIESLTRDEILIEGPLSAVGVAALEGSEGSSIAVDPRLFELLDRARDYCVWSQQAHGPLGGSVYSLYENATLAPPPSLLVERSQWSDCSRLALESETWTASLVGESSVELWGFQRGYAIDRAVEILKARGAVNGWVSIGRVLRAWGPGLRGKGWPMQVAVMNGEDPPTERILLLDQALAMASPLDETLDLGDGVFAPYINQRNGRPVEGKVAVLAATATALDAEALAVSLFLMNPREGEYRLGLLQPRPAVKWFLGTGSGVPLASEKGWSSLTKW